MTGEPERFRAHVQDYADTLAQQSASALAAIRRTDCAVIESNGLLELRAAAAARREAESRIEAAALQAHRDGASWGVIGAQLGMTRQATQ